MYGMTMCPLFCTSWLADWALLLPPSLTCLEDLLSLFSTSFKAHLGYLQLVRAFLRCSFSFWSNSGLLHMVCEKSTSNILQEYGIEAQHLFREWERLWLRTSDYKNHRILTLRCVHKELVPVSIKLKSTLTTPKARQIIRKAEKDLLQARVKAINNILDQVAKQTEECRTQLASIISAERLRECHGFINKVSEIRFSKVRQRQLNKFNILINKKEGNITRANATNLIWSNNLGSQSIRQARASPQEGNNISQTNCQTGTLLPSREVSSPSQTINSTPASSQASGIHPNSPLAIAHLPPREGSNSLLAAAHLLSGIASSSSSQAIMLHPLQEGSNASQATALLPPSKGSNIPQATSSSQVSSQASGIPPNSPPAIAHLPPGKGSNFPLATAHLPSGEGSSSSQAIACLPSGEGNNASQATALLLPSKGSSIPQVTSSPQAGQFSNPTRSVRQGRRHSPRHRAPQSSQKNSTITWEDNPTSTPVGCPKVLLMKNPTLSGSLTFPTNP